MDFSTSQPLRTRLQRLTTKKCLFDLSFSSSGDIAVSGYANDGRTFIDLYSGTDPNTAGELYYSKEFTKRVGENSQQRYVAFMDTESDKLVTGIVSEIAVISTARQSQELSSRELSEEGVISAIAVKGDTIIVALELSCVRLGSWKVVILRRDLSEEDIITIGDDPVGIWVPIRHKMLQILSNCRYKLNDLTLLEDRMFVCIFDIRERTYLAVCHRVTYPCILFRYEIPSIPSWSLLKSFATSITASDRFGLVAVLWDRFLIALYPINNNRYFLCKKLNGYVDKIRISDNKKTLMAGNCEAGDTEVYNLAQLFTFDDMKDYLISRLSRNDCMKLAFHFRMSSKQSCKIEFSIKPAKTLLRLLEEKGVIRSSDFSRMAKALREFYLPYENVANIYHKIHASDEEMDIVERSRSTQTQESTWTQQVEENPAPSTDHGRGSQQLSEEQDERTADNFDLLLNELSGEIDDRREVGRFLGFSEGQLHHIEANMNGNSREITYRMLLEWKRRNGSEATPARLSGALRGAGRRDLSERVITWEASNSTI